VCVSVIIFIITFYIRPAAFIHALALVYNRNSSALENENTRRHYYCVGYDHIINYYDLLLLKIPAPANCSSVYNS